jgi:hypothetical protein
VAERRSHLILMGLILAALVGLGSGRHGTLRKAHTGLRRDLEHDVTLTHLADDPEETADRHHLVSNLELALQMHLVQAAAPLGPHDEQPEGDDSGEEDERRVVHAVSMVRRSSVSALNVVSLPFSIASRAPAVSRSRKRRLCTVSSRSPSSSSWLTRCLM